MQLKDIKPGVMFRRPTGKYRYIKSPHQEDSGGGYPTFYCHNLDGQSEGYYMPGSTEVIPIYPDCSATRVKEGEVEAPLPFYMCYVEGASSPTMKHNSIVAEQEAERLAKVTRKRVYVLRAVAYADYTPPTTSGINWTKLGKDC
jgi:hypothetical protein